MVLSTPLKHQIVRTSAEHLVKPAPYLEINSKSVKPFQPKFENHRRTNVTRENPTTGPDIRFHAQFFEPSAKIVRRKSPKQAMPSCREIVPRGEVFERFRMSDVQATSTGHEKFSSRRSFLLKNRGADSPLSNYFCGP
jgi:hypothetical protein